MQAALDHREFIVARCRRTGNADELSEQFLSLFEFLLRYPQVCQFEQCIRLIGADSQGFLKVMLRSGVVSLALLDITHIEETRAVVRIFLQPFFKIFACFVETSELAVAESQERVRASGRIQFDQAA